MKGHIQPDKKGLLQLLVAVMAIRSKVVVKLLLVLKVFVFVTTIWGSLFCDTLMFYLTSSSQPSRRKRGCLLIRW